MSKLPRYKGKYHTFLYKPPGLGGSFSLFLKENVLDLTKREFFMLFTLVFFTVLLGIYPSVIFDGLHYSVSTLIYGYSESSDIVFSSCGIIVFKVIIC